MSQIDLGKVMGSRIHNVTGAPSTSLGLLNDWAMNTTNGDVYEKTGASTWTLRGNFKGATGAQGPQGERGAPFAIAKTYISIAAMEADYSGTDVQIGEFVLIDTGDVEDPDNAKLYYKGSSAWVYSTDLSGTAGIQGPQGPQGIQGETGAKGDTGDTGAAAGFGTPTATVDGNVGTPGVTITASGPNTAKVFNFAFTNLKGVKGDTGTKGEKGDTGAKGDTGPAGADGVDGITPTFAIDANGHLIATYAE